VDGSQEDDNLLDQEEFVPAINVQVLHNQDEKQGVGSGEQEEHFFHAGQDLRQVPDDAVCAQWYTLEVLEVSRQTAHDQEEDLDGKDREDCLQKVETAPDESENQEETHEAQPES